MILVTGGAGFIGSHTVRALHELGEQSLLVQRRTHQAPAHLADLPVAVEQGDVTDLASLLDIGSRHHVTGIVHLAGYDAWLPGPGPAVPATRKALDGLLNVVEAAQQWGVGRIGVASTIGVYGGAAAGGALREDMPVLLSAPHPIPRAKKINELLTEQLPKRPASNSSTTASPAPGARSVTRTPSSPHRHSSTPPPGGQRPSCRGS